MISRIDQQIRVNKIMIDTMADNKIADKQNPPVYDKLSGYYYNGYPCYADPFRHRRKSGKEKELWQYLKAKDGGLYFRLRHGLFGRTMNLPGRGGRKLSVCSL